MFRKHKSQQKKDISYWEQGESLVANNAVKIFTTETSQTLSTQQADRQESRQQATVIQLQQQLPEQSKLHPE